MSRSYMNRSTAIWREDDFRALSVDEQHMLFLIESQPDISAAGTLPLTLRRWAAMFRDGTVEGVRRTLADLENAGRVVVDDDTDELLLCTFIADDKGHRNTKRRPVILRAAEEVNSVAIRRALAPIFHHYELPTDVLRLTPEPEGPKPTTRTDAEEDRHGKGEEDQAGEVGPEAGEPAKPQVNRVSDTLSDRASQNRGDVGCTGSWFGPHPSTLISQPAVPRPAPSAPTGPLRLVAETLGTDDDETREVLDQIRRTHKPRNLTGYVKAMAANGDLTAVLDDIRRAKASRAAAASRRAARTAAPDPAIAPADSSATAEEAAAARAALRDLLAGRKTERGGNPAPLGTLLGKAASA